MPGHPLVAGRLPVRGGRAVLRLSRGQQAAAYRATAMGEAVNPAAVVAELRATPGVTAAWWGPRTGSVWALMYGALFERLADGRLIERGANR